MSQNKRQCQPSRFEKKNKLLGIKNIIFEIKALSELIIIKEYKLRTKA